MYVCASVSPSLFGSSLQSTSSARPSQNQQQQRSQQELHQQQTWQQQSLQQRCVEGMVGIQESDHHDLILALFLCACGSAGSLPLSPFFSPSLFLYFCVSLSMRLCSFFLSLALLLRRAPESVSVGSLTLFLCLFVHLCMSACLSVRLCLAVCLCDVWHRVTSSNAPHDHQGVCLKSTDLFWRAGLWMRHFFLISCSRPNQWNRKFEDFWSRRHMVRGSLCFSLLTLMLRNGWSYCLQVNLHYAFHRAAHVTCNRTRRTNGVWAGWK